MSGLPINVKKYLEKYFFSNQPTGQSSWELEWNGNKNITHAVVIPVICEFENIPNLLTSLSQNDNKYFDETLIIFVVNNSKFSNSSIKLDNQKSIALIRNIIKRNTTDNNKLITSVLESNLQIGLIDASSEGNELLDKDAGVGLARKIGMDLALQIFNYSSKSKRLITSLDADCTVDKNFITEIRDNFYAKNLSAAIVNYAHNLSTENENTAAIICYEIFLRYYVLGLHIAGSHYAYHSIGSTINCDVESYIKVEGMNKNKAAEDFYFLEKLAKIFEINKIRSTTVYPSSRTSWRAPFGTGHWVNRFNLKTQNDYLLYDPKSFLILKKWLEVFHLNEISNIDDYLSEAKKINNVLYEFLVTQYFEKNFGKVVNNSSSNAQLQKQKIRWFDAFKTLKLIHYLRDNFSPMINMFDALDEMLNHFNYKINYKKSKNGLPDIETQKEYLNILRKIT